MRMLIAFVIFDLLLFVVTPAQAKKAHYESWYQQYQCSKLKGQTEYKPKKDRWVRIDCELTNYSIEVDFASKHYEAVGQSLYYAALTGKKAGIWLIIENTSEMKHAVRLARNIRLNNLPITVWLITNKVDKPPIFTLYSKPMTTWKSKFKNLLNYAGELNAGN